MNTIYELPPILRGSAENQLAQLRDYLVRMARQGAESAVTVSPGGAVVPAAQAVPAQSAEDARRQAAALRALIVKTSERQAADKAELLSAIDGVEGTTLLHIESSRGTLFKHSAVSTVLQVVLYRGSERITDAAAMRAAFGPGARLQWSWQRLGEDRFGLISADDSRLADEGFRFTLGPQDVDVKVTFACRLIV